jgi:hypothetical protein
MQPTGPPPPGDAYIVRGAREQRVIVVFEDRPGRSALRLLRAGFRHCFCAVGADGWWTICDPLTTRIELVQLPGYTEHQLVEHYRRTGRTVLVGNVAGRPAQTRLRVRAITCVEIVKRVVNLDAPYALTPFRLQRALAEQGFARHGPVDIGRK